MTPDQSAEIDAWERRRLALVHDLALALSDGEWDALRWHFAQVWDEGWRLRSDYESRGPSVIPPNPYGSHRRVIPPGKP